MSIFIAKEFRHGQMRYPIVCISAYHFLDIRKCRFVRHALALLVKLVYVASKLVKLRSDALINILQHTAEVSHWSNPGYTRLEVVSYPLSPLQIGHFHVNALNNKFCFGITAQENGYVSTNSAACRTQIILMGLRYNLLLQVDTSL